MIKQFFIKQKRIISILTIVGAMLLSAFSLLWSLYLGKPKVAYIRSSQLVYSYTGMQEAHSKFSVKEEACKANLDSLKNNYQKAVEEFKTDLPKMTVVEKQEREQVLYKQKQSFENYEKAINQKMQDEDTKETESVLSQVNSFVADYGKEHGYDMIIGTTGDGNLLYAKENMDITDEVLKALNNNYKGIALK